MKLFEKINIIFQRDHKRREKVLVFLLIHKRYQQNILENTATIPEHSCCGFTVTMVTVLSVYVRETQCQ